MKVFNLSKDLRMNSKPTRKERILLMARKISEKGRLVLLNKNNDDNRSLVTPDPKSSVQEEEISSTEKKPATRLQLAAAKRQLFCNSNIIDDKFYSRNINTDDTAVSSTVDTDTHDDSEGDEDYIPDSEEESVIDSDSEYGFSKCFFERSNTDDRRNKTQYEFDINSKEKNCKLNSKSLNTEKSDEEIEVQNKIIFHTLQNNLQMSVGKCTEGIDKEHESIVSAELKQVQSNVNIQEHVQISSRKQKKRIWNKKDYCFFCDADIMKFSRHILRHHKSEPEVQEILSCNVGSRKRKILFNKLRNSGNFLKSTSNEVVVPVRKPVSGNQEPPTTSTYLPCKYCRGFYKKKFLYRHVKKCFFNSDNKNLRINAQSEGQSLFSAYRNNDILRNNIFPTMRADAISFTAKIDPLICAVARRYLKSHRDKQHRLVVSRKMRQLAALFIEIKKKIKARSLLDALDPVNFDTIVECTKIISRYDPKTETYGAPSLASHMGTELKDCIDVAYNMTLKKNHAETEHSNKLKMLKELIVSEWRYEISTTANNDLLQKQWNKPSLIPLAEDLALLKTYLLSEGEKCRNTLERNPFDERSFTTLQEITYVQVLLLNRRRVGELQRMTVNSYTTNINNQISNEFDSCISETEKVLMRSLKRVVIKGKRGRGVPVLFTEEMVKNTNLLLQLRKNFVQQENIYLFANTKSLSSITGSKTIYKHVRSAGAKNSAALTSTKLRKHLATMSQIINLSEQDLEQLANFMGHTSEIHKTYYRLPNDVYQMAKVSKLLLLNEKGEAARYKGKRLDEIDLNLDAEETNSDDDEEYNEISNTQRDLIYETNENVKQKKKDVPLLQNTDLTDAAKPKSRMDNLQNKVKRILEPWTETQKKVALSFFKNHLKNKISPKKKECLQLVKENPDLFANKSWEKIKIFIVNTYNKGK